MFLSRKTVRAWTWRVRAAGGRGAGGAGWAGGWCLTEVPPTPLGRCTSGYV